MLLGGEFTLLFVHVSTFTSLYNLSPLSLSLSESLQGTFATVLRHATNLSMHEVNFVFQYSLIC